MLTLVLRFIFYLLLVRFVLSLLRALGVGKKPRQTRGEPEPPRARRAPPPRPHLGDDIVDAEFEDLGQGKGS